MSQLVFAYFSLFVVGIRLKTMVKLIAENKREKLRVVLEDTICSMETLPCDYDEAVKIRLLERMDMALMLLWLDNCGDVGACLKEAQDICREHVMNVAFPRKVLESNDEGNLGVLDALPFDVRQVISSKLCV